MPAKKKSVKQSKQQMFTFGEAIAAFWTKYVVFSGTAQRSEFWWWVLFNCLISVSITVICMFDPFAETFFDALWFIATIIPWLALYSRRFHDAGYSSMWLFIPLAVYTILFPLVIGLSNIAAADVLTGLLTVLMLVSMIGFVIFWFVVLLSPSKIKNNPYSK